MNTRTNPSVRQHIALAVKVAGSQQELALALGVTQQAVSGWLNGARWMPVPKAQIVERRYGVQASSLVNPGKVVS